MKIFEANASFFKAATGGSYTYATIDQSNDKTNFTGLLLLVEGYRDASFLLLNELTKNHNNDWLKIDSLIYPALYLYRHHLEIILKDTLRYYRLLRSEISYEQTGFENRHSLFDLWKLLRPYLDETYSQESDGSQTRDIVEKLLTEFDAKDKKSSAFRYPFDSNGNFKGSVKTSLPNFSIDLPNLEDVCRKLSRYFEGVNIHVAHMLDEKQSAMNGSF